MSADCTCVPGHLRPVSTRLNFTHAFTPLLAVEAVFGDVPVVLEVTQTHIHIHRFHTFTLHVTGK